MSRDVVARSDSAVTRIGINAHLLSAVPGYRRAGIHQYIAQVLRHLPSDEQMRYYVYTRDTEALATHNGLKVVPTRWPTEQRLSRIVWEQSALPLQAARDRLDLLHSMAFVTPVVGSTPAVVTVYDLSFVHFPEAFPALQRAYLQSQTQRSVAKARRTIAISESSRQDLHRFFSIPLEQIDVIYPGVEPQYRPLPAEAVNAFRTQHGLKQPFVLHVGTLQPRKNIPVLLQAMAALPSREVDLVLIGARGWLYDDIFAQTQQLGLAERVRFVGYVEDSQLPYWYNAAQALAFPSIYEGFGMPIVEAMACGTPVVAAASSSIPEAGGDAALYFDPPDEGELARQLEAVLTSVELANDLRQRGLVQAQEFSWGDAGFRTAATYHKALAAQ